MGIVFIGAGLGCFEGMSLEAVKAVKECDVIYLDTYTSIWSADFVEKLGEICSRLVLADRKLLEDYVHKIVDEARKKEVGIVVPGDPFVATTHSAIRTLAHRKNVPVKIIHGTSVFSSAISMSGLHIYKFGKTVTVPKTRDVIQLKQVLKIIEDNLSLGLHSLVLLDTAEGGLSVSEALELLSEASIQFGVKWFSKDHLAVAIARLGFPDSKIIAGTVRKIIETPLPPPPHCVIFPSKLHFSEKEAILTYADHLAVEEATLVNPLENRFGKYIQKCRRIVGELYEQGELAEYIKYVSSYVDDAERFMRDGNWVDALLAIGYAEGLLDGLRLMKRVDFDW